MRYLWSGMRACLDRAFDISGRGSSIPKEVVAGITTFGAMAYIMAVNPNILASAGLDQHAMVITTIASAVVGSFIMAVGANLPIALAPVMSSNVVFAQIVVVRMGVPPAQAFTMVLLGGLAFLFLSLTPWRRRIVETFPLSVKQGIHFAIGAFVAHIGIVNGGLVTKGGEGLVFGQLSNPVVLLALAGVFLAMMLKWARVPAAILLSVIAVTIAGLWVAHPDGSKVTQLPAHWVDWPSYPWFMLFPYDFHGLFANLFLVLPITLYFFLGDFFDATGTMMAVMQRSGLKDKQGQPLLVKSAFVADATASVIGSALGTSTVSAYLESLVGVEEGGRTGLTALVVACLFAVSSILWPLIICVPAVATAPALILVGLGMLGSLTDLKSLAVQERVIPLFMLLVTVLTGDFMVSLAFGLLLHTAFVLTTRKWAELTLMLCGLDCVFILYLVLSSRLGS
ncbi:NCS2 family permease [Acetobacter pasteurianus]|uniref:Xanthine/uracil/vitamin C permease n=1 Tax=Acetobacter pasteurianus NBRC 3188 TaxID=1226663 RepID=A0A401WUX3_ACEPA|nr:NCS2 family permease [Acetobacter pasteurianus]GCD53139.1 xanthine/uracil/vitamin C permease [Acetobacter pasteurianus NBRC 3188]